MDTSNKARIAKGDGFMGSQERKQCAADKRGTVAFVINQSCSEAKAARNSVGHLLIQK